MNMLKNEWKRLVNNRILLISSIVILFIPILYGAFFLKSIWDPYGKTGELPVAVVNQDKSVQYAGKTLDVGDELVSNLRKNNDLDWEFVGKKEADKGMDDGKYYMVVTIPANFSKNASTLLDKTPKKMTIDYKTNPSENYIGEVVTKQGASQIKNQVATSVTKEYAKTMFTQMKEAGKGMNDAAKGADKLNTGSQKLTKGNKTLTDNLTKLANSTITFQNGADSAKNGANKVNVAISSVAFGASQLTDGANQLNSKVGELGGGVNKLSNGSSQVTSGISSVKTGTDQLSAGASQVTNGLSELNSKFPLMANGVSKLADGNTSLNNGLNELAAGTKQMYTQVNAAVKEGKSQESQAKLKQLKNGADQLASGTKKLQTSTNTGEFNQAMNQVKEGLAKLQKSNTSDYDSAIDTGIDSAMKKAGIDLNSPEAKKIITAAKAGAKEGSQQVSSKQNESLTSLVNALTKITDNLSSNANTLAGGANQLDTGVTQLITKTQNSLASMEKLEAGLNKLSNVYYDGVDGKPAVLTASKQLVNGTQTIKSQVPALTEGTKKLTTGSSAVTNGLGKLGSQLPTLQNGSAQVTGGLGTLANNVPLLQNGTNKLAGGLNELSGKLPELQAGTASLATGVNKLASGASQISSGTDQLASGSKTLGNGLGTMNDGTKELATKLGNGADKVNDVKASDKTYNMFSSPTKLSEDKMSDVPNYGHGLAPYVLSLGLYVGALVFNFIFPIRRPSMTPTSGFSWWLSKFSVGVVAAVLQALILDIIMLALGLGVDHMGQFITTSILTSLAYMFIVMLLAMSLGNPGRFLAMILLVLQLGGAGGTFPMPLTNSFFNAIHPFLPMSYSVYGFRQAISSGLGNNVFTHSALILAILFIVVNLLLIGTMHLRKNKRFKVDNQTLIKEEA